MAENKKSFVLYCDQIHSFENLEDDEAGRLIKHIFKYVNDFNPEPIDKITKIAFEPIKHQLKRDLIKYEGKKEQWSDAGKASAEARRLKKENEIKERSTVSTTVKERSTVSTVNDNVNVNVNDINNNKVDFNIFWDLYNKKIDKVKSEKKWNSLSKSVQDYIILKLPAYIKSTPDEKYRKNPLTYLNGKCWEDEQPEIKSTQITPLEDTPEARLERQKQRAKEFQDNWY